MKLFLSSVSIAPKNQAEFVKLVGKKSAHITVGLIENGADTYPVGRREWVDRARSMTEAVTPNVTKIDLRDYVGREKELLKELSRYDVVWVGGGNVFYLRWLCEELGFNGIIRQLLKRGTIYGGDSAGAILVCPTIKEFSPADEPEAAPLRFNDGLAIVDFVVVPHADHRKYKPLMVDIGKELVETGHKTYIFNDDQAAIVNGNMVKIV